LRHLWSQEAGTWPSLDANANVVPVVANGHVYVASYKQLSIFGLHPETRVAELKAIVPLSAKIRTAAENLPSSGPLFWGTIRSVDQSRVGLELRDGRTLNVDVSEVLPRATSDFGAIGRGLAVSGHFNGGGMFVADHIVRTKSPSLWGEDREQ
jgi:hypothetical protein